MPQNAYRALQPACHNPTRPPDSPAKSTAESAPEPALTPAEPAARAAQPATPRSATATSNAATSKTLSAETTRLYAGAWENFREWCRAHGHAPLPAAPATLLAYVESLRGHSRGALDRRLAAIAHAHQARDLASPPASPLADPGLRRTLCARKRQAPARRRPPPKSPDTLRRMADRRPGDLAGLRDTALLRLAAAGLGRNTLVGLDAEALRFTAAGLQAGAVLVARTAAPCPVAALRDWLAASATRFGPVFRKVTRWGGVEHERLGADALRRILLRRAVPADARRPR